jgi:hypothetical protein
MTYLKTTLIASAAITLMATPALAGEKMHKDHMTKAQATSQYNAVATLSPTDRLAWESKARAKMSPEKQAKWATYSEEERVMWMDKKIGKMMIAESAAASTTKVLPATPSYQDAEMMKRNDTIGEIIQADGDADPEADRKLLMASGKQMKKSTLAMKESDGTVMNNAIVVPTVGTDVLTTVSCPVGTTAQVDMTCLVTGNFVPTS